MLPHFFALGAKAWRREGVMTYEHEDSVDIEACSSTHLRSVKGNARGNDLEGKAFMGLDYLIG